MPKLQWIVTAAVLATASLAATQEPTIGRTKAKSTRQTATTMIVPGRSFGRVKIGMTKEALVKVLGKPNTEAQLDGDVTESIWYGVGRSTDGIRKTDFVAAYFFHDAVVQVDGSTPRFKTKGGLTTAKPWTEFSDSYPSPTPRKRIYPMDDDQPRMLHFAMDAADVGFGWVQVQYEAKDAKPQPDSPVDMIVVHRPGTRMLFGIVDFALWNEPGRTKNVAAKPIEIKKPTKKQDEGPVKGPTKVQEDDSPSGNGKLKAGDRAPEIRGTTVSGESFSLRDSLIDAKMAIVNFWFVSNDQSKKDTVKLQELYAKYRSQGLIVIGIDLGDKAEAVRTYLSAKGIKYPNMLDAAGDGPVNNYHILGFPCSVVVDTNGKIVDVITGFNEERLRKAIDRAGFGG